MTLFGHPDQIARVSVIIENFKKYNNKNILWKKPSIITDEIIKNTHDANYFNFVKNSFPTQGFSSLILIQLFRLEAKWQHLMQQDQVSQL